MKPVPRFLSGYSLKECLAKGSLLISVAGLFVASSMALAHHGWGGYRDSLALTVTVTRLILRNPHDRLLAVDADGNEWNLLLAPPARNRRFGFGEDSVSVGDVLELYGQKHPDRNEVKVHCLYRDGEILYTYRYDDGRTSLARTRDSEREDCQDNALIKTTL